MQTGKWVMARGINVKMKEDEKFAQFVMDCYGRYLKQDWGDTCKEDWKMNDYAVKNGNDRIVARYGNIFIITEWDRSVTTILFTHEY